jgi:A/G-specific adenine glycosylase
MRRINTSEKENFQSTVLDWYALNKRDLPWRETKDPYEILVSEIMLQQTQVDRVIPYFHRFLKKFPDFASLASGDKATVLSLWSGLGYNNRVLRLQKLSSVVVEKYKGDLPCDEEVLLSLPGIGPYTAHAVMAFAFNEEVPVLDTNIRRVLIYHFDLDEETGVDALRDLAFSLVPLGKSCEWHNALMDYGAMVLTARKTGIESLSKQPKFEGSTRQVRGGMVKYLLQEKKSSIGKLRELFAHEKFDSILLKMQKEGLVIVENDVVKIS